MPPFETPLLKSPTLRNLNSTAPYMHSGIFSSLSDVLKYYNHPLQRANDHLDILPLGMFPHELQQLEAFLMTLESGADIAPEWLRPPNKR